MDAEMMMLAMKCLALVCVFSIATVLVTAICMLSSQISQVEDSYEQNN